MAAPCQLSSKRAAQKGDGRRGHLSARLFGSSTPEPCTMPNVALPLRHGGSAAWEVPNSRAAAPPLRWPAARQVVTGPRKVQPLPFPRPRTSSLQRAERLAAFLPGEHDRPSGHQTSHRDDPPISRSEEHTSELQSLMRISYAVF